MTRYRCYSVVFLASCSMRQAKFEDAVRVLQEAIDENCVNYETYYNIGRSYLELRQFSQAEYYFYIALDLKPDYSIALQELGLIYCIRKESSISRVFLEKSIAADQLNLDAKDYLDFLEHKEGPRDPAAEAAAPGFASEPPSTKGDRPLSEIEKAIDPES